jgi:hypothetical protein
MEYAAGSELFERICNAVRFSEDKIGQLYYMGVFHVLLMTGVSSVGKILLPTTDFRSQLLSFNGI